MPGDEPAAIALDDKPTRSLSLRAREQRCRCANSFGLHVESSFSHLNWRFCQIWCTRADQAAILLGLIVRLDVMFPFSLRFRRGT